MAPAPRVRTTAIPTESEVHRLLATCSERAPSGVRNRALIALLYCAGPRVEELLALRPNEVDLEHRTVRVAGRRARTLPLFAAAVPYLETWLWWHAERVKAGQMPAGAVLFCTLHGAALEPAYLRALLTRAARRAGLRGRIHAHGLRHACAARLARSGVAAEALSEHLGLAPRGAARALAPLGIQVRSGSGRAVTEVRWSLAPEPGAIRAWMRAASPGRPLPSVAAPVPSTGIRVLRWVPEEL